jgi:ankyrin repeat protein
LEEIDKQNWKYARRLFLCIAAASRPLIVNELAEFLAFDFDAGPTPKFLADWRPEDPGHTVLSICSSLLAVVKPPDGPPVVHFAHFSVKEYLMSSRLAEAKGTISRFHVSMTSAHTIVAQACLGVLLHLDKNVTEDSLKNFPLAEYAARHWVGHARFENVSSRVQDGIQRLFDPSKSHHSVWVWVYDPIYHYYSSGRSELPEKARATALHYAAFCGMHDVAAFLIVEHSQDVNARGFFEEAPLHEASRHGHADVARLLLEHGADVQSRDDDECTPLLLASKGGHVEVVRVLLEHGADTEVGDQNAWIPLEEALVSGHVELVRVLLEHGAGVKTGGIRTPLHFAQGEEAARLLLEHGADADAKNFWGQTPLHEASENGDVGAARVLLEHGADVNARDSNCATPLHLASGPALMSSRGGHPDVVRLLLRYNSDIDAQDDKGQTPFMRATEREENHCVIQLLIEHGTEDHRTR